MSDLVRSDGAVSARPLSRLEVGSISRRLHVARLTVGWERISFAAILLTAIAFRANFLVPYYWQEPYRIHHWDEQFLPFEALAMWEGITPGETAWPASPLRLLLAGVYALAMFLQGVPFLGDPAMLLEGIARWNSARLFDATQLYFIGRLISVAVGTLQVWAAYWAARRWCSIECGLLAAFVSAVAPVLVLHSQLVLADISAVLFATLLLGVIAPGHPSTRQAASAGILLGLAIASKHHFAIWGIAAVAAVWNATAALPLPERFRRLGVLATVAGGVYVLFTPWLWLNPPLYAKEFAAVILPKLVGEAPTLGERIVPNLGRAFGSFGALLLVGFVVGVWSFTRRFRSAAVPMLVVIGVSVGMLSSMAVVYDRYGLFVIPAVVLISAYGWAGIATIRAYRLASLGVAAPVLALTVWQVVESQRTVGELASHARAYDWVLANAAPGSRIAVPVDFPHRFPRVREQLAHEVATAASDDAYARKMMVNGLAPIPSRAARSAVLNKELFSQYWAERELLVRPHGSGFTVVFHATEPRYDTIRTEQAIAEFSGRSLQGRRNDVFLSYVAVPNLTPAVVFSGRRRQPVYVYASLHQGRE